MALPTNFSVVTVMNVKVYAANADFASLPGTPLAELDSLRISNITQEGPRKESRGGVDAMPIIRHGKTMRLEMEDVIANTEALEALGFVKIVGNDIQVNDTFGKSLKLVGETFVIKEEDGTRQWVKFFIHDFLPDGIFDLTMESEGDVGVVNIAGELFANECGIFYEITEGTNPTCP